MDYPVFPLVSVCMTTYNHEAYLAQAIESVLAQQTSFGVELVLGDLQYGLHGRYLPRIRGEIPRPRALRHGRT